MFVPFVDIIHMYSVSIALHNISGAPAYIIYLNLACITNESMCEPVQFQQMLHFPGVPTVDTGIRTLPLKTDNYEI